MLVLTASPTAIASEIMSWLASMDAGCETTSLPNTSRYTAILAVA